MPLLHLTLMPKAPTRSQRHPLASEWDVSDGDAVLKKSLGWAGMDGGHVGHRIFTGDLSCEIKTMSSYCVYWFYCLKITTSQWQVVKARKPDAYHLRASIRGERDVTELRYLTSWECECVTATRSFVEMLLLTVFALFVRFHSRWPV